MASTNGDEFEEFLEVVYRSLRMICAWIEKRRREKR